MRFFTTFVIACASLASAVENEPVAAHTTLLTVLKEDATPTPPTPAVTPAPGAEAVIAELRKRQQDTFKHGGMTHNQEEHEKFCITIGNVKGCVDDTGKMEGDFEKATEALSAAGKEPAPAGKVPDGKAPGGKIPAAKTPVAKNPATRLI